jgi:RNA polymerase sigma-70 factor, ECF subfamily
MHTTSPSLLLELSAPENEVAWERFVRIYTPLLYHWSTDIGLQEADALDLVQDVLVLLVKKFPEFHYDCKRSFRGWLRTITLNKWRETLRHRPAAVQGDEMLARLPSRCDDWFEEVEFRMHVTRRALCLLQSDFHEETWKAFWQHVVVGKPAPVVARELGMTAGAIYAAKVRILARLQEDLGDLMVD